MVAVLQREWLAGLALGYALAGSCAFACSSPGAPAPAATASPGSNVATGITAAERERAELERAVRDIEGLPVGALLTGEELVLLLDYHCGECHFPEAEPFDTAGLYYMHDLDRLIEGGKIIPGDPGRSRLLTRILAGEMPPLGSGVRQCLPAPPRVSPTTSPACRRRWRPSRRRPRS